LVSAADSPKSTVGFSSPLRASSAFLSESVSLPASLHSTGVLVLTGEGGCARGCVAAALLRQEARSDIWFCIALSCCVTSSSLRARLRLSDSTLDSRLVSDAVSSLSWKLSDSRSSM
jgi:hypothetical protein